MNWKIYKRNRIGRELVSLSVDEERFLFSVIEFDELVVLEELLKCNVGLIHKICHKHSHLGVEYADLFSSGMIGLVVAAKKFDITKGNRFSTYCYYWIVQKIKRNIENNSALIRLPVHIKETIRQLNNIQDLSILEVVELTGKSLNCVVNAINASEINVMSLDYSGDSNEYDFYDVRSEDSADPLYDGLVEKRGIELIYDSLQKLTDMEKNIVMYTYGLGVEIINMVEFCKKFQINGNQYQDNLSSAMEKLKTNAALKEWFNDGLQ
jgi:RNA polymerase primary sigma factor